MHPNAPSSGYYELARAVAFANVSLDEPKVLARLTRQDPHSQLLSGICAYEPFVREIMRALRYPGAIVPARVVNVRQVALWSKVLRPLYGFRTTGALVDAWQSIRRLLSAIIHGAGGDKAPDEDGGTILGRQAKGLTLTLDIETLSPTPRPVAGRAPVRHRALLQPVQVAATYVPERGYPSLVYGVVLGAEEHLFNRLSQCQTCNRFILGRTDRAVRYCAEVECRALGSKARGAPLTAAARYKRAQRERLRNWHSMQTRVNEGLRCLDDANNEDAQRAAARVLARVVSEARQRLPECFRWGSSKARAEAERVMLAAEQRAARLPLPSSTK